MWYHVYEPVFLAVMEAATVEKVCGLSLLPAGSWFKHGVTIKGAS